MRYTAWRAFKMIKHSALHAMYCQQCKLSLSLICCLQAAQQRDSITQLELQKRQLEIEAKQEARDKILHDLGAVACHSCIYAICNLHLLPMLSSEGSLTSRQLTLCMQQDKSFGIKDLSTEE